MIESPNNVGIHLSPTRVQSWFENVDKGRSNNGSWQLVPCFNDPHGESGLPSVQPETSVMCSQMCPRRLEHGSRVKNSSMGRSKDPLDSDCRCPCNPF